MLKLAAPPSIRYLEFMKFTLADEGDNYIIRSYDNGEVTINEYRYTSSVIVTPKQIVGDWKPQSFEEITSEHFIALTELRPQLVILGTGATQRLPNPALYAELIKCGIGIEVMTTAAACRTYNILVGEGRSVAAALILT